MTQDSQSTDEVLRERFLTLPTTVQRAILSADIEENLRSLATTQKLHIDQWQLLENEVMMTVLGIQPIESLEKNIQEHAGVSNDVARTLTERINEFVFVPIRQELERQLEHPEAKEREVSGVEAARTQQLAAIESPENPTASPAIAPETTPQSAISPPAPEIVPATPPQGVPDVKVARPSADSNYKPGETSAIRAAVHDDPYRESPL